MGKSTKIETNSLEVSDLGAGKSDVEGDRSQSPHSATLRADVHGDCGEATESSVSDESLGNSRSFLKCVDGFRSRKPSIRHRPFLEIEIQHRFGDEEPST